MKISDKVKKRRQYHHERRVAASMLILECKKYGCDLCGEKRPECLDFHHIDPSTKSYTVSRMVGMKMGLDTIKEEIAKCQVLCSNCHRVITAREQNFYNRNNHKKNPNLTMDLLIDRNQYLINI